MRTIYLVKRDNPNDTMRVRTNDPGMVFRAFPGDRWEVVKPPFPQRAWEFATTDRFSWIDLLVISVISAILRAYVWP